MHIYNKLKHDVPSVDIQLCNLIGPIESLWKNFVKPLKLLKEFEDTKGVIRIRKQKNDRQHNGQKKNDRQHNGQKKNDRQHNGQKKKDKQRSTKH